MSDWSSFLWTGVTSAYFIPVGKSRTWQRFIKIVIQEMRNTVQIFLDNFPRNICFCEKPSYILKYWPLLLLSHTKWIEAKCRISHFPIFSVIAMMLGWFLYFAVAISTSLKLISVETTLCSLVNIPNYLTIFTK